MRQNNRTIKDAVCAAAYDAGFALCRITTADPVEAHALVRWIERGMHGEMRYMARDPLRRCNPRSLLQGARSVICCALPYGECGLHRENPASAEFCRPRRARFARGRDYHDVVREKLESIAASIAALAPRARLRVCVDTSPIMEKALAARAGLGWIGKNTLLIHPRFGSWLVLGEIITDLELRPDAALDDACGSCERCLARCPTAALGAEGLDARRCISYLTIEQRTCADAELAGFITSETYGCDACQEACPYNAPRAAV